jgi:hypothetical protein
MTRLPSGHSSEIRYRRLRTQPLGHLAPWAIRTRQHLVHWDVCGHSRCHREIKVAIEIQIAALRNTGKAPRSGVFTQKVLEISEILREIARGFSEITFRDSNLVADRGVGNMYGLAERSKKRSEGRSSKIIRPAKCFSDKGRRDTHPISKLRSIGGSFIHELCERLRDFKNEPLALHCRPIGSRIQDIIRPAPLHYFSPFDDSTNSLKNCLARFNSGFGQLCVFLMKPGPSRSTPLRLGSQKQLMRA